MVGGFKSIFFYLLPFVSPLRIPQICVCSCVVKVICFGFCRRVAECIRDILSSFQPEIVLYDAGVDPHQDDPLGRLSLTDSGLFRRDMLVISCSLCFPVVALHFSIFRENTPCHLIHNAHCLILMISREPDYICDNFTGCDTVRYLKQIIA